MSEQIQELKKYVTHVGGVTHAADRLGLKPRMIYAMLDGTREISVGTASRAELDSGGVVSRAVMVFGL